LRLSFFAVTMVLGTCAPVHVVQAADEFQPEARAAFRHATSPWTVSRNWL
jgi:hypothetical protein